MENALAEVYDIIMHSENTVIEKIPHKFIKFLEDNKNNNYKVNIDYNKNINNQKLLKDTRIILSLIYRDYLVTKEQKNILIEQEEKYLKDKYEVKFDRPNIAQKSEDNNLSVEESIQMIEHKESIFKKIVNKILDFFHLK